MQIFVEGNGVRYIDGDINFLTAKGNLTPIKEGNLTISFRNNITPQKTFNVADVRNAANATYGVTADAVILALSSLVFNDANGGVGGAVSSVNSQTGVVTVDLDSVLAQGTSKPNGNYALNFSGGAATFVPINGETVGSYKAFATTTIPSNYLWCNGATVLIATYPDLFAVIGNTYGGDGITTFAVPNVTDRFLKGDNGANIGTLTGLNTLTPNQLPQHGHSLAVNSDAPNTSVVAGNYLSSQDSGGGGLMSSAPTNLEIANSNSIGLTGSGLPHEHPSIAVRWAICFESVGINGASPTPSLPQVLAVNNEYIVLTEISSIADFLAGQTHYYIGKADITFDYDLLPYPLPNPVTGFNLVNQSVFDVTIISDFGNLTYLLKPNQSVKDIQVTDNGGAWLALPAQYFDNLYNLQETTDKGNVTTNAVVVRNNPDTYRTRYSIIGQQIQRDDLGFNLSYYDNGITKNATGTKSWQLQIPNLTGNANSSSFAVDFRPNISGTVAYLGDILTTILAGFNILGGSVSNADTILQAFGKLQNQINGVLGGAIYQGVWNANTNTPNLTSSVGTKGFYYVVSVAGATNLNGITDWNLGDWAIFNGTVWEKVDNTDAVISVNGFTGTIILDTSHIAENINLYFTVARVLATVLTGFSPSAGTVNATDTILQAIQKLSGTINNIIDIPISD